MTPYIDHIPRFEELSELVQELARKISGIRVSKFPELYQSFKLPKDIIVRECECGACGRFRLVFAGISLIPDHIFAMIDWELTSDREAMERLAWWISRLDLSRIEVGQDEIGRYLNLGGLAGSIAIIVSGFAGEDDAMVWSVLKKFF